MKKFEVGQKIRILTVDELLERFEMDGDNYIKCVEDVFVINGMSQYSNKIIKVDRYMKIDQFFEIDDYYTY